MMACQLRGLWAAVTAGRGGEAGSKRRTTHERVKLEDGSTVEFTVDGRISHAGQAGVVGSLVVLLYIMTNKAVMDWQYQQSK